MILAVNWLPTIGSLLGSVGQGLFSAHSASKAFERQKELWTYMQSNAHQLEIEDLKKAGLNPILSATNSQLAGMPSVSMERTPDNDIGQALNSALSVGVADKQVNANYDIALKQLEQKKRELDIMEHQSAAQISNLEAQRDATLEKIKGIQKENSWIDKLRSADFEVKNSLIGKYFAEMMNIVKQSELTELSKEKLESQLRYGEIFCRYLSPRLASKVVNKLDEVIERTDFNDFIKDFSITDNSKQTVDDYVKELIKNGVLSD